MPASPALSSHIVIGAGAVGTFLAALLQDAELSVLLVPRERNADYTAPRFSGDYSLTPGPIPLCSFTEIERRDGATYWICTKAYQTESILEKLSP